MRKTLIFLVIFAIMLSPIGDAYAQVKENQEEKEFNLIDYLKDNEVQSIEELEYIIQVNTTSNYNVYDRNNDFATIKRQSDNDERRIDQNSKVTQFNVDINEKAEIVIVTELSSTEESYSSVANSRSSLSMRSDTTGYRWHTVSQYAYSKFGGELFKVKSRGRFKYNFEDTVVVLESETYFTPSFFSAYESSVSKEVGGTGGSAYVKAYGTAVCKLSIAEMIGINITLQAAEYSLKLNCDVNGNSSYSWRLIPQFILKD